MIRNLAATYPGNITGHSQSVAIEATGGIVVTGQEQSGPRGYYLRYIQQPPIQGISQSVSRHRSFMLYCRHGIGTIGTSRRGYYLRHIQQLPNQGISHSVSRYRSYKLYWKQENLATSRQFDFPLSGVEKLTQAGEDGGRTPTPFHYIYHYVQSCCVKKIVLCLNQDDDSSNANSGQLILWRP